MITLIITSIVVTVFGLVKTIYEYKMYEHIKDRKWTL